MAADAPDDGKTCRWHCIAMAHFDFLVVGAGFAGAVVAERLARVFDKRVLVIDKRPHIAGNAFDERDAAGILVHRYGPHIFHTNSVDVFGYLSQFTDWRAYEHRVLASVRNQLLPIPINLDTVNRLYGWALTEAELAAHFLSVAEHVPSIQTSEDVIVSKVGRELYELFFRNYTRKQWGVDPSELDASVAGRVPVRTNTDDRYFSDSHQFMPASGYTSLFARMLEHPNISVDLGVDFFQAKNIATYDELIYTGPIDAFFEHRYGALPYRSLHFAFETLDCAIAQPAAVVNHPNEHAYTRVTEFKYLTGQTHSQTSLVYEYPIDDGEPYYPVPRPENAALYSRYRTLGDATPHVHFSGRLGSYRYFNMDQVVGQSLALCARLMGQPRAAVSAVT